MKRDIEMVISSFSADACSTRDCEREKKSSMPEGTVNDRS